jgi:archaellum component FlaD/FlaE
MNDIEEKIEQTRSKLKFLESLLSYPNSIKIENYRKTTMANISFLSKKLGYITILEKKDEVKKTTIEEEENVVQIPADEKSETDDDDMGFGLFD